MFYAHFVLSKKGPLARIWLAAHWDKKLTKAHVFETNIEGSVEAIIQPKVKLALRTSGHLLLGVVRIYSRKAKYLLADCNEAFVKIKMAFRPGVVDLPEENREAAVAAITLPETFHDFDTAMADLTDIDVQAQFTVHQGRPEEITMREDLGNITLVGDDGFGDLGFGAGDNMLGDVHMDDTLFVKNPDQSLNEDGKEKPMDIDLQPPPTDLVDEFAEYEGPAGVDDDDDDDNDGGGDFGGGLDTGLFDNLGGGLFEEPPPPPPTAEMSLPPEEDVPEKDPSQASGTTKETEKVASSEETQIQEQTTIREQTTLIPNEAEAFALEPIDVTSLGTERRTKRKRKLIIDEQKGIPSESMKVQLSDTSDIITTLDLAPPTKKLMHWKETGGVEKLFALPGRSLVSKRITQFFNDCLITKPLVDADFEQQSGLELEQSREPEEEPTANLTVEEQPSMERNRASVNLTVEEQPSIERNRAAPEQSVLKPPSLSLEITNTSQMSAAAAEEPSLVPEAPSLMQDPSLIQDDTLMNDQILADYDDDDDNEVGGPPSLASHHEFSEDEQPEENNAVFDDDLTAPPDDTAQMEPGESVDAFEERRWKGRTQQMMHILHRRLKTQAPVSFHDMVSRNNRKQVASKFYTLLVLKKVAAINVEQHGPFGDIMVSMGPKASSVL